MVTLVGTLGEFHALLDPPSHQYKFQPEMEWGDGIFMKDFDNSDISENWNLFEPISTCPGPKRSIALTEIYLKYIQNLQKPSIQIAGSKKHST